MAIPPPYSAAVSKAEQMYAAIRSVREFDKTKLAGIISGLSTLPTTDRDNCFLGTYYRTAGNVDSLLALDSGKHFQAAAMLARAMYELAVDIFLVDKVSQGWMKMIFFVDVEKLRVARKLLTFASTNSDKSVDTSSQVEFISKHEQRIEHNRKTLWPHLRKSGDGDMGEVLVPRVEFSIAPPFSRPGKRLGQRLMLHWRRFKSCLEKPMAAGPNS